MTLRKKAITIVSLTFITLFLILSLLFNAVVMKGFLHLEQTTAERDIERAANLVTDSLQTMTEKLHDWASWDDTYEFATDRNEAYINANLYLAELPVLGIDAILYFNRKGENIYQLERELAEKQSSLLEELREEIKTNRSLVEMKNETDGRKGILGLPQGLVLFSAKPILTSEQKGPANGTLVFIKRIDSDFLAKLVRLGRIDMQLRSLDADNLPPSTGGKNVYNSPLSDIELQTSTILRDIYGSPTLLLQIKTTRNIFQQGVLTYNTLILSVLAIGLAFAAVTSYLLEHSFLRRLQDLGQDILTIKENADFTGRVGVHGSDEIAMFAQRMNEMLEALHVSEKALEDTKAELEQDIARRVKLEKESEKLEQQLRQAQKMEAIGRLAGGVAHDFNNILTSIIGYTNMWLGCLPPEEPIYSDLTEIAEAANRAAALTGQLLAFSRKQIISPVVVNINSVIDTSQKIRRLIGEDIELVFKPNKNLDSIKIDPSQIDQILVNLVINARDAMPNGGKLLIETTNQTLDQLFCDLHTEARVGDYVVLTVSDTGCGIDKETLRHIFEPFFTTKEQGKGTGLGLATVYGIINQNKGFVSVYSEVGIGTTFRIYLPCTEEALANKEAASKPQKLSGNETILLVEDETMVRNLAKRILEFQGYKVLIAQLGNEALTLSQKHEGPIDLLLTDVVMPNMNGRELYEKLRQLRQQTKVLFMSGYPQDVIAHHGVLESGLNFIQKPFAIDALSKKVREVLDGTAGA